MHNQFSQQFTQGLAELGLQLDSIQHTRLLDFLELLNKWNQRLNLTAIHDIKKMISHHLLDSLAIAPYIIGDTVLDVGSGAGFPGIPLACYFPNKHFVLVESIGKKTHFLIQACSLLKLTNIEIKQQRVEHLSSEQYDCIISRAVCSLQQFLQLTRLCGHKNTRWIAMKGELVSAELQELQKLHLPYEIIPLQIPGVTAKRHVIIIGHVL